MTAGVLLNKTRELPQILHQKQQVIRSGGRDYDSVSSPAPDDSPSSPSSSSSPSPSSSSLSDSTSSGITTEFKYVICSNCQQNHVSRHPSPPRPDGMHSVLPKQNPQRTNNASIIVDWTSKVTQTVINHQLHLQVTIAVATHDAGPTRPINLTLAKSHGTLIGRGIT
jgi:hypothetical protein